MAHVPREQARVQATALHYDGGLHVKVAAFCAEKWNVATKKSHAQEQFAAGWFGLQFIAP
jgi:hypothetical protein